MSETTPNAETPPAGGDNAVIRDLRAKADRADTAESRASAAERQLAFLKAGIDPEVGVNKLLFDSFQGEPTPDAVKAHAAAYGVTLGSSEPAPPNPSAPHAADGTPLTSEELAGHAARQRLTGAGTAVGDMGPGDVDPNQVAKTRFDEQLSKGIPREKAAPAFVGTMLQAAAAGDSRVIYDRKRYFEDRGYRTQ